MALTTPTGYVATPGQPQAASQPETADQTQAASQPEAAGLPSQGGHDVRVLGVAEGLQVLRSHDVRVVEKGPFARAVCEPCGWTGPARRARASADADAVSHH